MQITAFEPWSIRDLGDFVPRDFRRVSRLPLSTRKTERNWVPAVDIIEHDNRFVMRADLPGVDASDIEINMDAGILTISGERKGDEIGESDRYQRVERVSGQFSRRFSLPDTANADGIKAVSKNGILSVEIPKLPEVQPRRINVETA